MHRGKNLRLHAVGAVVLSRKEDAAMHHAIRYPQVIDLPHEPILALLCLDTLFLRPSQIQWSYMFSKVAEARLACHRLELYTSGASAKTATQMGIPNPRSAFTGRRCKWSNAMPAVTVQPMPILIDRESVHPKPSCLTRGERITLRIRRAKCPRKCQWMPRRPW